MGLGIPGASLDVVEKRKIPCPHWELNLNIPYELQ
jgi:hypothetical protein